MEVADSIRKTAVRASLLIAIFFGNPSHAVSQETVVLNVVMKTTTDDLPAGPELHVIVQDIEGVRTIAGPQAIGDENSVSFELPRESASRLHGKLVDLNLVGQAPQDGWDVEVRVEIRIGDQTHRLEQRPRFDFGPVNDHESVHHSFQLELPEDVLEELRPRQGTSDPDDPVWTWILSIIGSLIAAVIAFFGHRWFQRRGTTVIEVGDRTPPTFVTRGKWEPSTQQLDQSPPRFMNFVVPLTIQNKRDVELSIRVKNVWFSDGRPEVKKGSWRLPGSCLHPTGVQVRNSAGEVSDPVRVPANGIEHFVVSGTATSPVCHGEPYLSWRFLFIDWSTTPVDVSPLIIQVRDGRSFNEDEAPLFPIPDHYYEMQGGGQGQEQRVSRDWRGVNSSDRAHERDLFAADRPNYDAVHG